MTRQTPSSLLLVGAIAGGAGFVAFVALMVVGDFTVSPAGFLAILVALATAVVLFQGFHRDNDASDRPARAPVAGDRTFDDRTIEAGTAGVRPGSAGVEAGTAGVATTAPRGATTLDAETGTKPSSAAIAPGPKHAADAAGQAPSAAHGGMPETAASTGAEDAAAPAHRDHESQIHGTPPQDDRARAAGSHDTARPHETAADVHRGHDAETHGTDTHEHRSQTETGDAAPAPEQSASAKVRSGTLLAGEEDLAARKGTWRYERSDTAAYTDAGSGDNPAAGNTGARIGVEPPHLSEAREGGPDDLKRIKGVGPKLEEMLHRMGFFHYDQIAAWSDKETLWVDEHLEGFKGRVERDGWVDQARRLAAGEETEFSRQADRDSAAS